MGKFEIQTAVYSWPSPFAAVLEPCVTAEHPLSPICCPCDSSVTTWEEALGSCRTGWHSWFPFEGWAGLASRWKMKQRALKDLGLLQRAFIPHSVMFPSSSIPRLCTGIPQPSTWLFPQALRPQHGGWSFIGKCQQCFWLCLRSPGGTPMQTSPLGRKHACESVGRLLELKIKARKFTADKGFLAWLKAVCCL